MSSIKKALFGSKHKAAKAAAKPSKTAKPEKTLKVSKITKEVIKVAKAPKGSKIPPKVTAKLNAKPNKKPKVANVAKLAKTVLPALKEIKVKGSPKPGKKEAVAVATAPVLKVQDKGQDKGQDKIPAKAKGKAAGLPSVKTGAKASVKAGKKGALGEYGIDDSVCREVACEGLATTLGYCRLHYIKNWKKIKRKELILKEGKLNQYIEELVAKYPDRYIEAIRGDLSSEKEFSKVIHDLDLDESVDDFDAEGESVDALIDSIKRDFDDDGDAF
ncbi:hypothetical protein WDW86_18100 [Bdellovibrionota bacterium FG-2]